jgi:RimJ/RimL family protein N-acetyltransferase
LELHHICALDLITLFEDPEDLSIYENKTFSNPYRQLMDDKGPLGWRVPQVKENPRTNKWFVRWIVLTESMEIVGSTSFHGVPDSSGMIEIGLGIDARFHNRGFATEALLGMWRWVLESPEVNILRYTVSPDNGPSIRVINKFGFSLVGQQIDEEDGPEDIYEMSREQFEMKFL